MMRFICYVVACALVCSGAWCIAFLGDLATGIFVAIIALVVARILVMDVADGVLAVKDGDIARQPSDGLMESNG